MYKETTAPCLAFRNMQTTIASQQNTFYDSGWRLNLPWLYYVEDGQTVIKKADRVQGKAKFESTSALGLLVFKMGKYNLEGDFLGFENLNYQLQL